MSRQALQPPRHYVPAAHEFGEAIRWGMGWGLLPEMPLHWQQWRHGSAALEEVAAAIQAAARPLR